MHRGRSGHPEAASAFAGVFAFAMTVACCVCARALDPVDSVVVPVAQQWGIELPPHHVQGLSVSAEHYWISTVDRRAKKGWMFRLDRDSLKIVTARDLTEGSRYHPGGIQESGGALWVPVAEYRPRSTTIVLKLDPTTLETLDSFSWDDHLGAIASDGQGTLFAANWDARVVYRFDEEGKLKEKRDNPTGIAYQDIDFFDGLLFGCGQATVGGERVSVVDALDPKDLELKVRYVLQGDGSTGDRNFSREGFAKYYEDFFVVPEDGPRSVIYRFGLPAK